MPTLNSVPGDSAIPEPAHIPEAAGRVVLDARDVTRALARISHEILERNRDPESLVILGLHTRGVPLAKRIAAKIQAVEGTPVAVGELDVTMYRDDLKSHPTRSPHKTQIPSGGIDGKTVILVDDVLFSGRTIRAALDALSDLGRPATVRLAVLVDRGHRDLPIRADHVGKNLPSARTERVGVRLLETDGVDEVRIADDSSAVERTAVERTATDGEATS